MLKYFCDRCGKPLEGIFVRADVRFRSGLPRRDVGIEFCKACVDLAFGDGFTARLEAEDVAKRKAAEQRKKERLAKKLGDTESSEPHEPGDVWEESDNG